MAAHQRLNTKESIAPTAASASALASLSPTLIQQLAALLPKDTKFNVYHLSTPPTQTSALYSAPPGARPDRTYCESHFLTASIQTTSGGKPPELVDVLVFAIEVLIYSTAYDTTFFVSKADSTGFLHLLKVPKGTSSPLKDISATFLKHLVEQHRRSNLRSVISLFARAQDQYLFPGSAEYSGKHVLDDRGLVRWWCRVLNPLIEGAAGSACGQWENVEGYLVIPGLDKHETKSYTPKTTKSIWTIGHPLQQISRHGSDVPPRCLIPHYPDDPKARYLDELDDEISKGRDSENGQWRSIKSTDQFWEMMAFRQECSAGRLVGFIWIVFTPKILVNPPESVAGDSQSTVMTTDNVWDVDSFFPAPALSLTPSTSFNASSQPYPLSSPPKLQENDLLPPSQHDSSSRKQPAPKKKKLRGRIFPRQARVKTENKNYLLERPESTAYYSWPSAGRGQVIMDESDYKRVTELLLRLDFSNLELASSSSRRWISEVRSGAWGVMGESWGQTVIGTKVTEVRNIVGAVGANTLNMGLVRKKRKVVADEPQEPTVVATPAVNVLSAGMIRKKAKA